jgi:hypothetical protein
MSDNDFAVWLMTSRLWWGDGRVTNERLYAVTDNRKRSPWMDKPPRVPLTRFSLQVELVTTTRYPKEYAFPSDATVIDMTDGQVLGCDQPPGRLRPIGPEVPVRVLKCAAWEGR